MKDVIQLEYIKNAQKRQGQINREDFFNHMKYLAETFENNENSSKLIKLIPEMTYITINQDINQTQDVPFIQYKLTDDEIRILKILRTHRIIWAFIQHYCDETK